MNDNTNPPPENTRDEVNLKEIITALTDSKKFIAGMILLFALSGVTYSLLVPQIWTSQALMTIAQSDAGSGSSSAAGGLAAIASFGKSVGNIEGSKAVATARSREFFTHIVGFDGVLENLMATKRFDHESQETIFYSGQFDSVSQKWVNGKPSTWSAYKAYLASLNIILDSKTAFITISINHRSPIFAESFLSLIIQEINDLSRQRDLEESEASLQYLYKELESSKQSDVRLTISQLIESQLKKQMLARVKSDYILESLDSPFVPRERTSPQRTRIVLICLFIGTILSVFYTLVRFYVLKNLKKFND
jgi:capsular polysaccharide biosynthesis protein